MRAFQNLPIKWKLMLAMLLTSMIAVLLLGSSLFFAGLLHLRNLEVQETAALAEIVGGNCAATLERRDAKAAQRELGEVGANPTIEDACLYAADGQLLARYTRGDLTPLPLPQVSKSGENFAGDRLTLYRPVKHDGRVVGTIYLRTDSRIVWARLKSYAGMGILVMGISMLVALIFANRLQRFFSAPIQELVRVAQGVAERKDFTLRATRLSNDETGLLTDTFNKMLGLIQEHDSGSRSSQSRLEKRVAERTVELRRVNETLRESEQRLTSLIQSAAVAIVIHAADGSITRTNETARKLLGLSESSALGKQLTDPAWVFLREDGTVMPREEFPVAQVLARRAVLENFVFGVQRRQSQDLVWVLVNAVPLFDAKGNVSEVIVTFMDITERRRAEKALQRRLEIEHFVAFVSSRLANTASAELDVAIREVLVGLGQLSRTDRCYLFRVSEDLAIADNTHEWCAPGVRPQIGELRDFPTSAFPWYLERMRGGEPLLIPSVAGLPAAAVAEKRLCESGNTRSLILVPIRHAGALVGFIGCDDVQAERDWTNEDIRLLRTIGELITDTSARLRAGEALREGEHRYRTLTESLPQLVWTCRPDGPCDYLGPQWVNYTGVPEAEQLGYGWSRQLHPDDWPRVQKTWMESVKAGAFFDIEFRIRRHDGVYRWFRTRALPLRNMEGQIVKWFGTNTDIDDQKQAEESLQRSEADLKLALDAAQLAPWHWNIVTGELHWSAQCLALYGLPAGTHVTYEQFLRNIHPDDRARVQAVLQEAVKKHAEYVVEKRVLWPDGSVHWTASRGRCHYDDTGRPIRMDGVSFDITQHKEAEEALLESEDRYRSLFATSLDAVLLGTVDGRILAANTTACQMFGLTEEELISVGRNGIADVTDPRLQAAAEERNRTGSFYGELTFLRSDGTKFPAEVSSVIFRVQEGESRVSVVIRDITERKRAEEALKKSQALLAESQRIGNVGGWEFDIDTKKQTWTEEVYRIHEVDLTYQPTVEEGIKFYTPASRPIIARAVQRAIEHGEPFDVELEITTARGNLRQVHAIGRADLEHRKVLGFFQDISARKQAEEALKRLNETLEQRVADRTAELRQREAELKEAQRVARVGSWTWNLDTGSVTWSEEIHRVFGRDPNQPAPSFQEHAPLLTAESIARLQAAVQQTVQTGAPYELDMEIIRSDGAQRWIAAHGEITERDAGGRVVKLRGTAQDITERKRAEEALRESEARMRVILDSMQTGIAIIDAETHAIVEVNPVTAMLIGSPKEKIVGNVCHAFICPAEDGQCPITDLGQAVDNSERQLLKADGTRIPVIKTVVPIMYGGRKCLLESFVDITERKHAQDALRQSEDKFQRIVGHIQDVLYSVDTETREFRYISPAFEKMFGYTEEDIRNMGGRAAFLKQVIEHRKMSVAEETRRLERLKSEPKEGVAIRDEEWWRCKDGTLRCIEDRWIPVYQSGRLVTTEGLLCDITERRRAEAALRESQERYSSLITNLNVGVYRSAVEDGGRFLQANPALARMLGYYSLDEFMKVRIQDLYENPADRKMFLDCLLSTDSVTGYELRQRRKDGTLIHCAITAAAHRGPDGKVEWVDGIVEDITERKWLEDQLLEISEREQRRIGQDLHDGLCQHLAGVGFMSKALAQKLDHSSPAEAADARAVANLIRQAINEARGIATGLHPVKKEANAAMVALQELAANIESMFRIQCVFRCDPPVLIEDNNVAIHLYRIAQEATNNAIRHGKAGHIWITLAETDHRITLTVKDDGKGIPQPLPDTRGIGIDIMNHRARMIGGLFNIGRAPEGGTILTCSFPKNTAA